ncbi:MAG TPA: ABC transporter ATP-binding protein [Polyangia bacterium]|nr:ABC transporter ATP-binding protein [Polyangia bacterium]
MGLSSRDARRAPDPSVAGPVIVRRAVGLALRHGATPVLQGIDLEIGSGQTLAIVGANGCGKTTLLRALAGLLSPCAGALTWPAGPPSNGTGMLLLQDEAVAPFSTRELVTLGLGRDGPPTPTDRHHVATILAALDLASLADRPCSQISGGEWQRARLARALISRPPLILFDEPTNHLDPATRAQLLTLCTTIPSASVSAPASGMASAMRPAAVVLATHDLDLAARCDLVLLLAAGTTLASGAPGDVLTPPLLTRALHIPVRRHILPGDPIPLFRAGAAP